MRFGPERERLLNCFRTKIGLSDLVDPSHIVSLEEIAAR
jgi:hypothetical protein